MGSNYLPLRLGSLGYIKRVSVFRRFKSDPAVRESPVSGIDETVFVFNFYGHSRVTSETKDY